MLRRGVRAVAAECSYGTKTKDLLSTRGVIEKRSIPVISTYNRRRDLPVTRQSSFTLFSQAFGTSSKKGKEREVPSNEEKDAVIDLLSLMMKKRELLLKKKDWTINVEVAKQVSELEELHRLWLDWHKSNKAIASLLRLTSPETEPDEEMRDLAVEEAQTTLEALDKLRYRIKTQLLPNDPIDDGSAIIEARIAIGGDESAVFVAEVSRMYTRYCENILDDETGQAAFQVEEINAVPLDTVSMDAYREVILHIKGKGAYKMLRNEAGIHRVQRIPATQAISKLQSSTIAILVLPGGNAEGKDESQIKDDVVDPKDVKTEVMRSRGAGGQHVNKTESAVRLTHEPSGITVSMQDSRSQHQNRTKAWAVLRARLQDRKIREEQSLNRDARKSQIGGMDRSDRIRTYNFPQDRVTDHRVPINVSGIDEIMNGERDGGLAYLIDALRQHQEDLTLQHLQQQVKEEIVLLEKEI